MENHKQEKVKQATNGQEMVDSFSRFQLLD